MVMNRPELVLKSINAVFAKSLLDQTTEDEVNKVAEVVISEGASEEYVFFDSMPAVNEFLDKIDYQKFKSFYLQIQNKEWQYGVPVKRTIIEDTVVNGLQPQIQKFIQEGVRSWVDFPMQLVSDLLLNGGSNNAFDGTPFFANSRPNIQGANTINNIVSGTGVTPETISANFLTAINRLLGFKAKNGRAYNRNAKFLVITPPHLASNFWTLQRADRLDSGKANILVNNFDILINYDQEITNNDWYLVNSNAVVKPFIYQKRKEPFFDMVDNQDEPIVKFFSTARANAGYGNPMSIVMVNN